MSAGGILGAVAGFFIGGPKGALYGYQIGSMVGSVLDPPKGPRLEGPRLTDLTVQTSTYGAVIPRGYGTFPVVGNVFWLENNALKEVATTTTSESGGKGGGGSSTTTTTYAYYATFAVGLCEGPIEGIRRIWMGSKQIYDAGSYDLETVAASNAASGLFTLHLGTDTQLADDRMQSTLGVTDVPAYRGLAYLVFKDYPLAEHGNSLMGAQVKVEVIKSSHLPPYQITLRDIPPVPSGGQWVSVDWSGTVFLAISSQVPSGSPLAAVSRDGATWTRSYMPLAAYWLKTKWTGKKFVAVGRTGYPYLTNGWLATTTKGEKWDLQATPMIPNSVALLGELPIVVGATATAYYDDHWGTWIVGAAVFSGQIFVDSATNGEIVVMIGNQFGYPDVAVSSDGIVWTQLYIDPGHNGAESILFRDGSFYAVNQGYCFISSDGLTWAKHAFPEVIGGSVFAWTGFEFFCCGNASKLGFSPDGVTWTAGSKPTALGTSGASNGTIVVLLDSTGGATHSATAIRARIGSDAVLLGDVVAYECLGSRFLAAPDFDVSALTQAVRGYRVGAVASIRSAIEPLQGAWPFDVVQHGYTLRFVPRGGASIVTVPAGDLDARAAGEAPGVAITLVREMDSILPVRVSLKFLDVDREYDVGEQYAERLNTEAINIRSIDISVAMTAAEAAAIAERLLYLYWLERYDVSFRVPETYNQIEPADILTILATEGTYTLRLAAVTYTADGRLECKAKYHSAATYLPTALGEAGLSTGSAVAYVGDSSVELLDIPLLLDATDTAGFVAAMNGYTSGWPGGVLVQTLDAGATWANIQAFAPPSCKIGVALAAIGAGRTDLIDASSVLGLSLRTGDLASVTEDAMLNGANHFAYGAHGRWEIIAAKNCVLQGDGTYLLSDLLRGRFGTEWACGLHGANDTVIALDSARLAFIRASIDTIGAERTYRCVTAGKSLSTAEDFAFTYTGVNLECLSPVYLNGNRHPTTNDWTLDWIRRTRVGGAWRDYVDAPISEASQAYEVDIFSNGTYTTLKRTLTGLATPAATYTSAQQVTDFGSNQATLYVKVYQLSANVGRGYPLTTSITR